MSHNNFNEPKLSTNNLEHERQEKPLDGRELILSAFSILLSDICLTRFNLLMVMEQDPSEAAKEIIESLDRYDFLSDLAVSNLRYIALKKQIESNISNEAERVIREENPR